MTRIIQQENLIEREKFQENQKFICESLGDTKKAAEYFANNVAHIGSCFALYGTLGAGKTTFAQFLIKALIPSVEHVSSPTFTIVQTYEGASKILKTPSLEIWHVDCYRLKDPEEFYELGLEEAFESCVTIIEWPEIVEGFLPDDAVRLKLILSK